MAAKAVSLGWRQSIEPWYLAYALFSAVGGGIGPILLPQRVVAGGGHAADVGLVFAAIGFGGLTAALWAGLADRFGWHRGLFVGGLLTVAVALAGFPVAPSVPAWVALAFALGVASGAVNTMANLFIVESHGEDEWDTRIGWVQTFYNGGTVAGLLLAGAFSHLPLEAYLELDVGLISGAAMAVTAAALGWRLTHTPARSPNARPVIPIPRAEWMHTAFHVHLPTRYLIRYPAVQTLHHLSTSLRSPFALFLAVWVVCNIGPNAVYTLYPLLMQDVFGIIPGVSSLAQALGFGLGLALYSPAGLLVHRDGAVRVLLWGLAARLAGLVGLTALGAATLDGRAWLAVVLFTCVTLTWPLLSVSSAVLVSRLSPLGVGQGMGAYNTAGQLAGLLGPLVGGYAAHWAGYNAVWGLAVGGLAGAIILTTVLTAVQKR